MRTNFDPPADPFWNEAETPDANGEWYCPKCGRTRRTYRDNGDSSYCAVDGRAMIWKPDEHSANSVWCGLCEVYVAPKDFILWSGDDMQHWLCPGCDSDMRAPQDPHSPTDKSYTHISATDICPVICQFYRKCVL